VGGNNKDMNTIWSLGEKDKGEIQKRYAVERRGLSGEKGSVLHRQWP